MTGPAADRVRCNMTWHLDHWRTGMKIDYYITMLNGCPDLTVNDVTFELEMFLLLF